MATGYCDPDADSTPVQWTPSVGGTHFGVIDDGTRQPAAAGSDNIFAGDGDENAQGTVTMDNSINDVDTVSQVKIWTYGRATSGEQPYVSIYIGGSWKSNMLVSVGTSNSWASDAFNGAWTQADLDGLQVRYIGDSAYGKFDGSWVLSCYAEVTYTVAAAGYGHDVMGVPAANIDNVMGVPTANIDKIIGV